MLEFYKKADINQPDGGCTDQQISEALNISTRSIERVRQRFVEESLENALNPRPKKSLKLKKIDGEAEAHLIAPACSQVPQGYNRWTLRPDRGTSKLKSLCSMEYRHRFPKKISHIYYI